MRANLAIMITPAPDTAPLWFYIPGQILLEEVSRAVAAYEMQATKLPPGLIGSPEHPLALSTPLHWLTAFVRMRNFRDHDFHFRVAGRLIKKWRGEKSGGFADGFYISDVALSGKARVEGQVWSRREGASYREFGKFMASCMPKGNELGWSEDIANRMRTVLRSGVNLSAQEGTSVYSALPLLASAMFLVEASRNNRAWLMAHMMLDSMGQQYSRVTATNPKAKFYTWDRVLAHPERIDPGYSGTALLSKPQKGPTGLSGKIPTGLGNLTTKGDLVKVEGKLPASPSGSAHPGSTIDVATNYIQKKEASLTIRWLVRVLTLKHPDYDMAFATWPDDEPLTGLTDLTNDNALRQMAAQPTCSALKITLVDLQKIRLKIQNEVREVLSKRCMTFDAM